MIGMAACTTSPSSKLAPQIAPLQRVWVVVSMGSFSSLDPGAHAARRPGGEASVAMRTHFPDTLRRNGLAVSGFLELARPLQDVAELRALWNQRKAALPMTSHVLVLTAQRLQAGRIEYEAVLWDAASETLAWKGAPSFAVGNGRRRTAEGETLAGDLLRAFHRDQLLTLDKEYPVDGEGAEIPRQWVPIRLF